MCYIGNRLTGCLPIGLRHGPYALQILHDPGSEHVIFRGRVREHSKRKPCADSQVQQAEEPRVVVQLQRLGISETPYRQLSQENVRQAVGTYLG